jgi:hypothetical protein
MKATYLAAAALLVAACGSDDANTPAATGGATSSTGGAPGSGGAVTGGVPASSGGGAAGGAPASSGGAVVATGGAPATGTGGTAAATGGAPSSGGSSGTGGLPIFLVCSVSSDPSVKCDGVDEYAACIDKACPEQMTTCFGGADAGPTGGECAEYGACATAADDPCNNDCTPQDVCDSCLRTLVSCIQTSACTPPRCSGASTTNPTPTGTCADLDACCQALTDASQKSSCTTTLNQAKARSGDPDCAIVFTSFKAAGICK